MTALTYDGALDLIEGQLARRRQSLMIGHVDGRGVIDPETWLDLVTLGPHRFGLWWSLGQVGGEMIMISRLGDYIAMFPVVFIRGLDRRDQRGAALDNALLFVRARHLADAGAPTANHRP